MSDFRVGRIEQLTTDGGEARLLSTIPALKGAVSVSSAIIDNTDAPMEAYVTIRAEKWQSAQGALRDVTEERDHYKALLDRLARAWTPYSTNDDPEATAVVFEEWEATAEEVVAEYTRDPADHDDARIRANE